MAEITNSAHDLDLGIEGGFVDGSKQSYFFPINEKYSGVVYYIGDGAIRLSIFPVSLHTRPSLPDWVTTTSEGIKKKILADYVSSIIIEASNNEKNTHHFVLNDVVSALALVHDFQQNH